MLPHKSAIEFGIIGLGRFGTALARELCDNGSDVLVLDNNETKIRQIRNITENAFVVHQLDTDTLMETGIQNCGTVIVCIGGQIDTSILTTLNLIEMGIPRVIAKAKSADQGKVLSKLGAEVVYPESDMAVRVANRLLYSKALDFIELQHDIIISEFKITSKLAGKTVLETNTRKRFKINMIAICTDTHTTTDITPEMLLNEDDIIVVVGKSEDVKRFEIFLNEN